MQALDQAIDDLTPDAFDLLGRLVAEPSVVANEAGAQEVIAAELAHAGFAVERLPIPDDIDGRPGAGIPALDYEGRYDVVGRRLDDTEPSAGAQARSLVINGHMDVVPAEEAAGWTSPPFAPTVRDGWLFGRGAGDMKAGFAAGLLAINALDRSRPDWLGAGRLTFVSAIEEEYTGNGTLAACHAGHVGDAALLLEPTDLGLLLAGIAIIWVDIVVEGHAGHAESASRIVNPIQSSGVILDALRDFEERLNHEHREGTDADPVFSELHHPYNVNVGEMHAGDWASSVPPTARLGVRVGYPARWSVDEAFDSVRDAVLQRCAADEWLREHPPTFRLSGFRAERYAQPAEGPLIETLQAAHADAHGSMPDSAVMGSTTDARFYLNQFGMPAVAYGPRTVNMHGTDEGVELKSIVDTARTVARFLLAWFGAEADGGVT